MEDRYTAVQVTRGLGHVWLESERDRWRRLEEKRRCLVQFLFRSLESVGWNAGDALFLALFCFFVRDSQMSSIGMLNALWKPLAKMESNPNPDPTMLNQ